MWVTQGKRGNLKGPNTELLLLTAFPTAETCLLAVHHSGHPSLVCSEFPALNQSVCPKNGVHELTCIFLWLGWDWMVCCQPHLKHVKLVPHKKKGEFNSRRRKRRCYTNIYMKIPDLGPLIMKPGCL